MITHSDLGAAVLLLGMIMYSVFGGADFGGGIWTAFASGPRKKEQRESLFHAIGPVWETNHVWLIFMVVVLFMVFPKGFAYLFIALLAPLVIALVGINFRGAGGPTTPVLLLKRKYLPAQIAAAGTVTLVLLGFEAAMYPDLILGEFSIAAASAPRATLMVFFAVLPFGAALLALPSFSFTGPSAGHRTRSPHRVD